MKIYKKLFSYISNEKYMVYFSMVVSGVSAFFMVYGHYCIYKFFKDIIVSGNIADASINSIKVVFYLTLSAMLYILSGILSHKFAFRLETNLRKKGIDGLTDASFRFFDLNSSGFIRKTIDDNAAKTHMAVAHMIPDNVQAFLIPIFSLILAFLVGIRVGVVITVLTVVCGLIIKAMMGNLEFMKLYQEAMDTLSSESVEYVRGMQVVKIFNIKIKSFKAFHKAILNYSKYAYDYSISCKTPYVIYQLIFLGLIAIITIPLSFFLTSISEPKVLDVELIMIFFLSGVIMVSFMKIMWASKNIFDANFAIDSLDSLFSKMQEDKLTYGNKNKFDNYNIEFKDVSFSYGKNKVLDNLSFKLYENKIYALVGHSGSGKSTIAKLLSGFYKLDSGFIKIGGFSLEEYTKETIIKNIAFVFQDTKLFKKSIYENIALANETATKDDVLKAIELSECGEIINKFKDKENTIIGSKGVYLSVGEIQRIAIARAILKNSPIVIMDEASASIDADNEYKLQKALKNLMKNKTVIMIAHRLSSIKNVDEILVLENGKIIERGNDKSLKEKNGLYSKLEKLYEIANDWRVSNEELL